MVKSTFICRHCNSLLETEQKYANQVVQCPFCHKSIAIPEETLCTTDATPENKQRFSSAYCIGGWTEILLNGLCISLWFSLLSPFTLLTPLIISETKLSVILMMLVPLLLIIYPLSIFFLKLISDLQNPQKKICRSIFTDICLLLWFLLPLFTLARGITSCRENFSTGLICIISGLIGGIAIYQTHNFYILRSDEDENFSDKEISTDQTIPSKFRRRAIIWALLSYIIPFLEILAFVNIHYARTQENQQNMWRIKLIATIPAIIRAISILSIFISETAK